MKLARRASANHTVLRAPRPFDTGHFERELDPSHRTRTASHRRVAFEQKTHPSVYVDADAVASDWAGGYELDLLGERQHFRAQHVTLRRATPEGGPVGPADEQNRARRLALLLVAATAVTVTAVAQDLSVHGWVRRRNDGFHREMRKEEKPVGAGTIRAGGRRRGGGMRGWEE